MKIPLNLILSAVLFQVFACEPLLAEDPETEPGSTVSEKKPISPETEMAIMRGFGKGVRDRFERLGSHPFA